MERSQSIGIIIPDISNPVYAPIVRGVEDTVRAHRLSVLIASSDNDQTREEELLGSMADQRIDGLLLATASRTYPMLHEVNALGIPVVFVNRCPDNPTVPFVTGDDERGIALAVDHLRSLGHTKLAHLAGTETVSTGYHRRLAFMRRVQESGLAGDPNAIVSADMFPDPVGIELGVTLCKELLGRGVAFTGIVAANDLMAVGCYDVFKQVGLSIPADVSIIGYNDVPLVDRLEPPLTTIRSPHYEIGQRAASALLDLIAGGESRPETIALAPELIARGSTAPPKE
ncbi:MAG TPA: substrate-binding domain-containing protein [Streptosporangiaceae bacterium]|nr:substrate-binding domain-containing protein [Streptosporangiaceae bacterium]